MTDINNLISRKDFLMSQWEKVRTEIKNLEGVRNSYTREITLLQKRITIEMNVIAFKELNK